MSRRRRPSPVFSAHGALPLAISALGALLSGCPSSVGSSRSCEAVDGGHPDGEIAPIAPLCPGGCDETAARSLVFNRSGRSMYAGQAMIVENCAVGGNFCHSSTAVDRLGVPVGLDFDIMPTRSTMMAYDREGSARLARSLNMVYRQAGAIWSTINNRSMPPGAAGADLIERAHSYGWVTNPDDFTTDTPLPTLDELAGREIVRNWLACRAPVVEAWEGVDYPNCSVNSACPTGLCEGGECTSIGDNGIDPLTGISVERITRPISPNWPSIYAAIIDGDGYCTTPGCHFPDAEGLVSAGLDMSTPELAYEALVGVAARDTTDSECADMGWTLVVAGNPDTSLLMDKITHDEANPPACGDAMPQGQPLEAEQIAVIREWIMMGAPGPT